MNITAIDLFCGAGGLTRGLANSGIDVRLGVDLDPACEFPYTHNNSSDFLKEDISNVSSEFVSSYLDNGSVRLIAGCAPCQPFSNYSRGRYKYEPEKWRLLNHFKRLVEEIQPEIVTMENVSQLRKHTVFDEFQFSLKDMGYFIWDGYIDCHHYGLPQTRRRLVLLASKLGEIEPTKATHPNKNDWITVRDTISSLPKINAGGIYDLDRMHTAMKLSEINMKRIKSSRPGGSWRDWPKELIANCHKKPSGRTYTSVYGRMSWDAPSPTITTQCYGFGNGRFGHPVGNRAISLREAAMLQSFDKDYSFIPDNLAINFSKIGRLIGNAVPVKLGEVIGKSIIQHLEFNQL